MQLTCFAAREKDSDRRLSGVLCDARILNIFEGAAEIQTQVVCRGLIEGRN